MMCTVTTTAMLEDNITGASEPIRIDITEHGSKTDITVHPFNADRFPFSITIHLNTEDIQRARMRDLLEDGRN